MELIFPWVIYIGIAVVGVLGFISFTKKHKYKAGKKVANSSLLMETGVYKSLLGRYKLLRVLVVVLLLASVSVAFVMLSRPASIETIIYKESNRDIMLCLDISDSMDDLNNEICEELKDMVKHLDGDRFGITIFNAKAIELVPLTSDYEYVIDTLDQLGKAFEYSSNTSAMDFIFDYYTFDYATYYYKYEGTLSDYGSSFIGDGLATSLFNFSDLYDNPDRTRLIVFCTDNELNGTPLVTVSEATDLCRKNNVQVFALYPDKTVDIPEFVADIEKTGGEAFRGESRHGMDDLIDAIEATDTSDIIEEKTVETDKPEMLFIALVTLLGLYFVVCKRLKV